MGWNSGTFTRSNGDYSGATVWATDKANGHLVVASRHDTHDQDIAAGINACIHKGGQNSPSANLPMGGYRHTGVSNGTARSEYASVGQLQDMSNVFINTTSGTNTITATLAPAPGGYVEGAIYYAKVTNNNTGAATINFNGLGNINIKTVAGYDPLPGELQSGIIHGFLYDGTNFILLNPYPAVQTWTPTYGAFGSMTYTSVTNLHASWIRRDNYAFVAMTANGTTGGSASNTLTASLPFTVHADWDATVVNVGAARIYDGSYDAGYVHVHSDQTTLYISKRTGANFGLGSTKAFDYQGFIRLA